MTFKMIICKVNRRLCNISHAWSAHMSNLDLSRAAAAVFVMLCEIQLKIKCQISGWVNFWGLFLFFAWPKHTLIRLSWEFRTFCCWIGPHSSLGLSCDHAFSHRSQVPRSRSASLSNKTTLSVLRNHIDDYRISFRNADKKAWNGTGDDFYYSFSELYVNFPISFSVLSLSHTLLLSHREAPLKVFNLTCCNATLVNRSNKWKVLRLTRVCERAHKSVKASTHKKESTEFAF